MTERTKTGQFISGHKNINGGRQDHTILDRLLGKVLFDTNGRGCWVWIGSRSENGYGQVQFRGRQWRSHRVSWSVFNGAIPEGKKVLHKCDNPPCINPNHLFTGTQSDNLLDCSRKGRLNSCVGERGLSAKLKEADVLKIRSLNSNGVARSELAKMYGVHVSTVDDLINGRSWGHLAAWDSIKKETPHA